MKTDGVFRFFGPLQRRVYCILTFPIFFTANTFFVDVFTQHIEPCGGRAEETLNRTVPANISSVASWTDDLTRNSTCHGARHLTAHGQATYMTGLLVGSLIGGALSDRYGKKVVLVCFSVAHAAASVAVAFLPCLAVYLTARGVSGLACCAIHICTFSLGVEWSLPKNRIWPPTWFSFIFSVGMMGLAAVACLNTGWMQFHLALAIPQILFLPLYFFLPESPRWLLLNEKRKTLEEYRHRSPTDRNFLDHLLETVDHEDQKSKKNCSESTNFSNFRSPTILLRLFIMSYIGFASALTYYGICFSIGSFGVNIYLAQFFSGLSESPTLLLPFLLKLWGRRSFTMGSLFLSGISCMLSLLVSSFCDIPGLVMTLALMGKLCMQSTTCVYVLYGIELFPTVIRQKCIGLVNLCYRMACIINAVVPPEGGISTPAMICYSGGPVIGAALCLLLPETSSVALPDTVQDCERQPRLKLLACERLHIRHNQDSTASYTKGKTEQNQHSAQS